MVRTIRAIDGHHVWIGNLQTGELEQAKVIDSSDSPMAFETRIVGRGDNLMAETESFINLIQGKSTLAVSGEDGKKALDCVEQITTFVESQRGW